MPVTRTIEFLPAVFQTEANRKFLNATLDQLTTDPNMRRINGYIGRRFAPTARGADSYIIEPSTERKNYQLEPGVVVKNKVTGEVDFQATYPEFLQKLRYYGAPAVDQNLLWDSQSYTYNPHIELDKFVNFSQYYWLPAGPDSVAVNAGTISLEGIIDVTFNQNNLTYSFTGYGTSTNPDIILARGGTYQFNVNQPGRKFWIQTSPGGDTQNVLTNISSREIYGVNNNGTDNGVITFTVPDQTDQDFFTYMPRSQDVDIATTLKFTDIQNKLISELVAENGSIDGHYTESNLDTKYMIFLDHYSDDSAWTVGTTTIPASQRTGIWHVQCLPVDAQGNEVTSLAQAADFKMVLTHDVTVPVNHAVTVKSGYVYGGTDWYLDTNNIFARVPVITAILDTLYYQDAQDPSVNGVIRLVNLNSNVIDIDSSIVGRASYTSPNGVTFTNGLKVKFGDSVIPAQFRNQEYYVDGVGESIVLTPVASLGDSFATPDYIVINRSSLEKSLWAQGNRWFHSDVIKMSAYYNNVVPQYDQNYQARRPIIEFEPNIQLFNFGAFSKDPVDLYDTKFTQPLVQVSGVAVNGVEKTGFFIDGVELVQGMRVIFANDRDPTTRNKIWVVNIVVINENDSPQILLTLASDGDVKSLETVVIKSGIEHAAKKLWYKTDAWVLGQAKTGVNQPPLFDVFDYDGNSFGDQNYYPVVTVDKFFTGTKIFGYAIGTGTNDSVLGFPLVYKNVGNIGDIVFENNFDQDALQYTIDRVNYEIKVNTGRLRKNTISGDSVWINNWDTMITPERQYQEFNFVYSGDTKDNGFAIDVLPNHETTHPTLYVYLNGKLLPEYQYYVEKGTTYSDTPETNPGVPMQGFRVYLRSDALVAGSVISIFVDSNTASKTGFYEFPAVLDKNAQNTRPETITLGEFRNHVTALSNSSLGVTGNVPGTSNLRDLKITNYWGNICQQTANAPLAMICLVDDKVNFVDSVIFNSREFTRFKNRFLEAATNSAEYVNMDPAAAVDAIIETLNSAKNKSMPWFYSDMVPCGGDKNVISYNIFNPRTKRYEISNILDLDVVSNKSILVYHNGNQLLHDIDYTLSSVSPAVDLTDNVVLAVNDTLVIVEYNNTDGCYIPETPSKMGMYPKFIPTIHVDKTYVTPVLMIRGHDGSNTVAFTELPIDGKIPTTLDFRDNLLIELEKRIYNNIKVAYDETENVIYDVKPGKFRDTGYSLAQYNNILTRSFMSWVGANRLDYLTNNAWSINNVFTWNYRGQYDVINQEELPGSWRACYEYFYDTQTPHLTPWQMLGFGEKPTWWEDTYGPAPYTGGNKVLWEDLSNGYIAHGNRAGYDNRFTRPGLMEIIPVDDRGELLPPSILLKGSTTDFIGNRQWSAGSIGPVENAWRQSSEYPFALQIATALMAPGKYFGLNANKQTFKMNVALGQYTNATTNQRLVQRDLMINGALNESNNVQRAAGYLNWIGEYLRQFGIAPETLLGHYIQDYEVRLAYRMAGFSDKKYLKILAEQYSPASVNNSVMIPDSDYDLVLNKSTPARKITYSAVIIEKTAGGYRVSGYDTVTPVFTIIPPDPGSETYNINVLSQSVTVYKRFLKLKVAIPYGYEFATLQQVANFLTGYGLYLTSQGFRFNEYDSDLEQIRNWDLSIKEFLTWSQQGWKNNSVIILSPVGSSLNVDTPNYSVDVIGNSPYGSRVLNQNFQPIGTQALTFSRIGNQFKCQTTNGDMISLMSLNLVQYEHTLIFNNSTMFSDVIYRPEQGLRQYRLKLVGFKTGEWDGTLSPTGFMYSSTSVDTWQTMRDYLKGDLVEFKGLEYTAKTNLSGTADFNYGDWVKVDTISNRGLLPNFTYNSTVGEHFYDVDQVNLESQYDLFGKGLIGYRSRDYLNTLGLDDISQVKFYQGFIKEKGTNNAFSALGNVSVGDNNSIVTLSEEWAFRVGEYGALETTQYVDLELSDQEVLSNPFSVQVTSSVTSDADVAISEPYATSDVDFMPPMFINRDTPATLMSPNDVQTAGFPELSDVDYTLFDIRDYKSLTSSLSDIGVGTKIWCAKDFNNSWNVYRVVSTNVVITGISNALDRFIEITTSLPHKLVAGDVILNKGVSKFSGFYQVSKVTSVKTFIVEYDSALTGFVGQTGLSGEIYALHSMVFDYAYEVANYTPADGWKNTDFAWIRNNGNGRWGTYQKITPWEFVRALPRGNLADRPLFGTSVNLSVDNLLAMAGNPSGNNGVGEIVTYTKTYSSKFRELVTLSSTALHTKGLGQIIEQGNDWAVIGAPASGDPATNGNAGYAFVTYRTFGTVDIHQILVADDFSAGAKFGTSVSISQDDTWMIVGAPGAGRVYVYGYNPYTPEATFTIDPSLTNGSTRTFILNFTPESVESISVATDQKMSSTFLPYIDYTVSGATITFTAPPESGVGIVVRQTPGWRLVDKVSGSTDSAFGFSVAAATDGAQFLVSAPKAHVVSNIVVMATDLVPGEMYQIAAPGTTNFTLVGASNNAVGNMFTSSGTATGTGSVYKVYKNAGCVNVYDRSVESFIATGNKIFTPRRLIKPIHRVLINDIVQPISGYTINSVGESMQVEFTEPPPIGARIDIETNEVNVIETIVGEDPQAGEQLGYNVNLCPTNCSVYVGVPSRTIGLKQDAGAVIRFFNTGRQSGNNLGVHLDPVSVTMYETSKVGSTTLKVAGTATEYPKLLIGNRVKSSESAGVNHYALITDIAQTAPSYFTVTLDTSLTQDVYEGMEIAFERVPRVKIGHTVRINDFEVEFTGTELEQVVAQINNKNIPGVTASIQDGYLYLESNVLVTRRRLRVLAGTRGSTAIQDLGLRVYPQIQLFTNPYENDDKYFGKKVRITRALPDYGFMIGSDTASTYVTTTFDSGKTTFDNASTIVRQALPGSGAVYIFTFMGDARSTADFPPGQLAFAQQFVPTMDIPPGLHFGIDFDIQDQSIIIGAPEMDYYGTGPKGTAQVYEFVNPQNELGWVLASFEGDRVNLDSINKFYLWDKKTNVIINTLDYIDPAKGKILGLAEQEITYKTSYDPASYNVGDASKFDVSETRHWTDRQVGQVWWNLDTVRYIDYEHGATPFRATNWGAMFPGSQINVYEWVESIYLPSDYVTNGGDGIPAYPDNSAYVTLSVVDTTSNKEYNKYYYWVKGKHTVDSNVFGRNIPITRVTEMIENPKGQSIKYVAAVKDDTVALFNCADNVVGTDTVLHVDYDTKINTSIIHSEWELVKENIDSGFSDLPERIFNKLLDSLSGIDRHGNVIPDPLLPVQNRYGIGIRPRQGIFVDHYQAVKSLVTTMNQWLSSVPLSTIVDVAALHNQEQHPPARSGEWDIKVPNLETLNFLDKVILPVGYKVLVETDTTADNLWTVYTLTKNFTWFLSRVQSYDDAPYWEYADWYADGFDATTIPKYTVKTDAAMAALQFTSGDVVKVLNDGSGKFKLVQVFTTGPVTVGIQNGTIKFNDSLYDLAKYGMGWNNSGFGSTRFDQNPSIETRHLFQTMFKKVLINQYKPQYGKVMQSLINYVLSEQKKVDWMFKTRFVSVLHKLRKLTQPPVYSKDNQESYYNYLEEVKPYSATIREYVLNYDGIDNVTGYTTDFDVPAYYDDVLGMYRGPSGEYYQDRVALENQRYNDWRTNYQYTIPTGSANILLVRPGKGYVTPPEITITGSATGENAIAEANMNGDQISTIVVTKVGINYLGFDQDRKAQFPTVSITGGGLPETFISLDYMRPHAQAVSGGILINKKTWQYFEVVTPGTLGSATFFEERYSVNDEITVGSATLKCIGEGVELSIGDIVRTPAYQYFRANTAGVFNRMPDHLVDGSKWINGTVGDWVLSGTIELTFLGEEAIAVAIIENFLTRKIKTNLEFNRVTYGSRDIRPWEPNTLYAAGTIITYRGKGYQVVTDYTSSSMFDRTNLEDYRLTANDKIRAFYQSSEGAAGNDPDILQTGISYPGVNVVGPTFLDEPGFDNAIFDISPFDNFELNSDGTAMLDKSLLDTVISSHFTDDFFTSLTDTRVDGIVIDGGEFIDVYNSYAPEELVPGRAFDAVDIQVHQLVSPSTSANQSPSVVLQAYTVGDYQNRRYPYGGSTQFNDVIFVYAKTRGRLIGGVDYIVDYIAKEIEVVAPLGSTDTVFIYAWNQIGFGKQTEMQYIGDGVDTKFSTELPEGSALSALVFVDGVKVTDFEIVTIGKTQYVEFTAAPTVGSYIHVILFKDQIVTYTADEILYTANGTQKSFSTGVPVGHQHSVDVLINGTVTTNYSITEIDGYYDVVFETAPVNTELVLLKISMEALPWSEVHTQVHVVPGAYSEVSKKDPYVVVLDRACQVAGPYSAQIIVEVGKSRLRPPTYAYYNGDGSSVSFVLPTTDSDVNAALANHTLMPESVNVYVDGKLQKFGVNYLLGDTAYASNMVTFNEFSVPAAGAQVAIEVTAFAEYNVARNGTYITINPFANKVDVLADSTITIDGFSNHDSLGIETRSFVGGQVYTTEIPIGFDYVTFDDSGFDTNGETNLVITKYDLQQEIVNIDYVWVTLNGRRLMPVFDFVVNGQFMFINPKYVITDDSVLVVTTFAYSPQIDVISFRQFKDITGKTEYLRISLSGTTELTSNVGITDTTLMVANASKLPVPGNASPGVVFIDGERITYYSVDLETNTLSQVQRGTGGTGACAHYVGARVVDGSSQQQIPGTADVYSIAVFKDVDGKTNEFTTAVPNSLSDSPVLYLDEARKVGFEDKVKHERFPGNAPTQAELNAGVSALMGEICNVYVGGVLLTKDQYTVELVESMLVDVVVYTVKITLIDTPIAGIWVSIEIRSGAVWYNIETSATTSALANSTTNQAKFLKEEVGFLL